MYIMSGSVRVRYHYDPKEKIPICFDYSVYSKQGMGIEHSARIRFAIATSQTQKAHGDNNYHSKKG